MTNTDSPALILAAWVDLRRFQFPRSDKDIDVTNAVRFSDLATQCRARQTDLPLL